MSQRSVKSVVDHPLCTGCEQHTTQGSGCNVVEPDSGVPLDAFLSRSRCYIKERMLGFAVRVLRHRPATALDPEDLMQDVVTRLLQDPSRRAGEIVRGLPSFLAYLRTATVHGAISRDRSQRGRMRCGSCLNYAPWVGRCLHVSHAWSDQELGPGTDPRKLEPPCTAYESRKDSVVMDPQVLASTVVGEDEGPDADDIEAVHAALLALAQADPRAALVVRARMLEEKSYDDLVRPGTSLRTLKREYARGLAWLRTRLESEAESS